MAGKLARFMADEPYDYSDVSSSAGNVSELQFNLGESFPNPANWKATIPFSIHRPGHVYMEIINPRGKVVDIVMDGYLASGTHMVNWKSINHPAGLYLYRMHFHGTSQVGKIMVYH